jgi:hypothetical protein
MQALSHCVIISTAMQTMNWADVIPPIVFRDRAAAGVFIG